MKVALVCDWMYGGGAERVVQELHAMYPDAPIYTSYCSDEWRTRLDGKVVTGYLQKAPFRQLRKFLPLLRQRWFRKLDLSGFDLVISCTGNGEAKFVRVKAPAKHICYCFTPTHFYWRHYDQYVENPGFRPKWLVRIALKLLVKPLRKKDYAAAQLPNEFVAISTHIQNDIKEFYGRDSALIHPPVDIERFEAVKLPKERHGFVTMGRQTPYKKTEIIIEACNELGLDLTVIGRGPEHDKLFRLGGPTVTFRVGISDIEMAAELAKSEGFIFAALDDFGIAPVEAMATGIPVLAYKAGGALDFVIPGKSGEFFEQQSKKSLVAALKGFKPSSYEPSKVRSVAREFSGMTFQTKLSKLVASKIKN